MKCYWCQKRTATRIRNNQAFCDKCYAFHFYEDCEDCGKAYTPKHKSGFCKKCRQKAKEVEK